MPVPPPIPDPAHIETRLLVVATMLEKAVAEVHRTMAVIRGDVPDDGPVDDGPSGTATPPGRK